MMTSFHRIWQGLKRGRSGHRFQDRYAEARKFRHDSSWAHRARRVLRLIVALVAVVIAVFLMVFPGPAIPFFFLAGTLLASESLYLARAMDWAEVRLRKLWKWGKGHWVELPGWGQAALVILLVSLSATSTYISYRLMTN